ncbi:MAG: peroxidase family protein [Paracoccaceae bacterium]
MNLPRQHPARDTTADGLMNRIEAYALSNFRWLWQLIMAISFLRKLVNKSIINRAVMRARTRPSPYGSMAVQGDSDKPMAGYTSWELMMDRSWYKRHLPQSDLGDPGHKLGPLPDVQDLRELYQVEPGEETMSETSTVLFLSFAQWFTDGFLMTDTSDQRKTHTSHHIDFNPLYGLDREQSDALRERSEEAGRKGRMKSEIDENGEEWAPKYFDENGNPKPEFAALRPPLRLDQYEEKAGPERTAYVKQTIFAFAGDRANTTPFTAMLNNLFLREHNRVAGLLEAAYSDWDDERVFQVARNVNVAQLIKIVVEDYINHISPYWFQINADPSVCWKAQWNKPNWIPIEFNLLYRWHSLTPSYFEIDGKTVPGEAILFDNSHLTGIGMAKAIDSAGTQRAWNMGLLNTPEFLVDVEIASIAQGRTNRLGSYNDYREAMGYGRVTEFEQITGHPKRIELLKKHYGHVDKIEFFVGLFAEDVAERAAVPPLIGRMVALDAFSQALTNPLLSQHTFNPRTFSDVGWKILNETSKLSDVVARNVSGGETIKASFDI